MPFESLNPRASGEGVHVRSLATGILPAVGLIGSIYPTAVNRSSLIERSNCNPVLNALLFSIGFENGPLTVPSIPSGRKGRLRKIKQRPVIATEPSSFNPSALAASAYLANGLFAKNAPPCAERSIEAA